MTKTCSICGGPVKSGEQVLPAALVGRRTNKDMDFTGIL